MDSTLQQIRTIAYAVWRKRWYGLAAMWAVCLVGWLAVSLIPNQYRSEARIYVRYNSLLQNQIGLGRNNDAMRQVDIVRRTLTSRPNLEKVLRRTDLDLAGVNDVTMDALLGSLAENISVNPQGSDNLYLIRYTAANPELSDEQRAALAQRVVQNLIDIFVEDNVATDRDTLNQNIQFLDEQIALKEQQLEEAEARRAEFEQRYLGRLPGEGNFGSRLAGARAELERVRQELNQARSSLGILQSQLASTSPTIDAPLFAVPGQSSTGPVYSAGSARGRIQALEAQITDSMTKGYTEKHPDIVNAREQIARLQALAANESEPAAGGGGAAPAQPNPTYVSLRSMIFQKQSEAAALASRQQQLASAIGDLQQRQVEEPNIAAEEAALNRDYGILRASYENLLKSRESMRLRADVGEQTDVVQFQTIDPPSTPTEPVAPDRATLLTLVLLGGLAAGVAVAFLASQLHPVYVSQERLAADTGVPVLGSVSEVQDPRARERSRRMLMGFGALGLGLVGVYALLLLLVMTGRGSIA